MACINHILKAVSGILLGVSVVLGPSFDVKAKPVITLANDHFPPYVMDGGKGFATGGVAFEVLSEVFRTLKIEQDVQFVVLPWARVIEFAKTGDTDGVMFLFRTKEREKFFDYTEPLVRTPLVIFYSRKKHPDGLTWKKLSDLKSYRFAVTRGASYGKEWDEAIKSGVLEGTIVSEPVQTIRMVQQGRVDFTPMNLLTGLYFMKQRGMTADQIGINEKPINYSFYHMAFSKKSPSKGLVPRIDQVLQDMKQNGLIDQILDKYRRRLRD